MAGGLAVVLSGGGAKGAFQTGVLDELVTNRGVSFDVWAGVSTGAIQALGGAMGDIPGLVAHWRSITGNKDIYTDNAAILGESLHITKPLRARLKAYADPAKLAASGKKLLLGVVNLQTGAFRTVDGSTPNIDEWVYASCAMPVFFPPLKTESAAGVKEQWVDGGVRDVTPLDAAMAERPRAILVIRASAPKTAKEPKQYKSLIKIGLRASAIQLSEVSKNDIGNVKLINDLLRVRKDQEMALAAAGLAPAAIKAVLKPFDDTIAAAKFVPILVIEPTEDFADTLEFSKATIDKSIAAGQAIASARWLEIKAFLGV